LGERITYLDMPSPAGKRGRGQGMLTIFTSPKPFRGHIDVIQRNAIRSWLALGEGIEVLLVGQEEGMAEVAAELNVAHLPDVARNDQGTPLLDSIFAIARRAAGNLILCYVNADILLLDDLLPAVRQVANRFPRYLVIGQRWDLDVPELLPFDRGWPAGLRARLEREGSVHPPAGSDYFVFPRELFINMPPFALGRAGWDNWMIYAGRAARYPVVDATGAVTIVHQSHDYSHLPGGQPHYHLPESQENVALAGGREVIFTLADANWVLTARGPERKPWWLAGLGRRLESGLIARLGPGRPSRLVRILFHPGDAVRYYARAARSLLLRRLRRDVRGPGDGESG
jgi:hypothetical protein